MSKYETYNPEINIPDESAVDVAPRSVDSQSAKRQRRGKPKPSAKKPAAGNNRKPSPAKDSGVSVFTRIKEALTSTHARILLGVFTGCLAVYFGVSFVSYFADCVSDQSVINSTPVGGAGHVSNDGGEAGARLSEFLINECFGLGSLVIVVWLVAMTLKLLVGKPHFKSVNFTIKCFVALITVSLIIGLVTIGSHSSINWGGYHGTYINEFIINFVGWTGAILLSFFMVTLFVVICLRDLIYWILRIKRKRDARRREERRERELREAREREIREMQNQEKIDDIKAGETAFIESEQDITDTRDKHVEFDSGDNSSIYSIPDLDQEIADETDTLDRRENGETAPGSAETKYDNAEDDSEQSPASEEAETAAKSVSSDSSDSSNNSNNTNPSDSSETEKSADDAKSPMVVNVNSIGQTDKKRYTSQLEAIEAHKYKFPPFDLLRPGKEHVSVDAEEQLENKARIESTLLDFKIPIVSITATVGPTVTLYEIVPDKGVPISKIRRHVEDIALRLSAEGVRIIAPIPGKGTVGIEVANKDAQTVSMQTVIKSQKYQNSRYALPVALGSTISNEVYITDLAKMPHLLVAGATGQGKSVGLNAIIASLLYCKAPHELKLVLIDPKQLEFSFYNKLKNHYMAMIPTDNPDEEPVICDVDKVEAMLSSLTLEMDNRYTLLKSAAVRNIEEYNAKIRAGVLPESDGHHFLPYIVVVVDEFGDLMMMASNSKNIEIPIARLAQKARACGINVVIATQRPSTDVITGLIKANFPARMSFKVTSGVDSKTILDSTGAEHLIGRGDMLMYHNSNTVRVQCAFIDTPEVEQICDYISRQPYPTGPYWLPAPKVDGASSSTEDGMASGTFGERDPLFEEVANLVVTSGIASASNLQRRFGIGYNRASKIMDQMEALGIVGPSMGGKPREIKVGMLELDDILSNLK